MTDSYGWLSIIRTQRIDNLIKTLEDRITRAIGSDDRLSSMVTEVSETLMSPFLLSIPGIGPLVSKLLIGKMHKTGTIAGGRRTLRHVMFEAALSRCITTQA